MRQRIITGGFLVIVLAILIYFGEGQLEYLFSGFCVMLSGLAAYEFTNMSRNNKTKRWFDYISVFTTVAFATMSVIFFDRSIFYIYVFIFILGLLLFYTILFISIKEFNRSDFGNQLLTVFYASLGFIGFAYLRKIDMNLIIYLFLVSMVTDVFAYLIGVKFGKHRLAVDISPKKSIEGAVGGLVFGAVIAAIFAHYLEVFDFSFWFILLLSVGLSCISQIGDLIASKFKRETGIKDYSNLLPGHGGILDRFDSSMFAAIFLMLAVIIF